MIGGPKTRSPNRLNDRGEQHSQTTQIYPKLSPLSITKFSGILPDLQSALFTIKNGNKCQSLTGWIQKSNFQNMKKKYKNHSLKTALMVSKTALRDFKCARLSHGEDFTRCHFVTGEIQSVSGNTEITYKRSIF